MFAPAELVIFFVVFAFKLLFLRDFLIIGSMFGDDDPASLRYSMNMIIIMLIVSLISYEVPSFLAIGYLQVLDITSISDCASSVDLVPQEVRVD